MKQIHDMLYVYKKNSNRKMWPKLKKRPIHTTSFLAEFGRQAEDIHIALTAGELFWQVSDHV